jgi:hypothetical protein
MWDTKQRAYNKAKELKHTVHPYTKEKKKEYS